MPSSPATKKMRILPLVAVIFFTVSGGPYGLEPLLGFAGDHGALLLLMLTPMLWDLPAIFTVLELNSMMPVEGGYYRWVKHALGTRWGFFEGWWTWLYTFIDLDQVAAKTVSCKILVIIAPSKNNNCQFYNCLIPLGIPIKKLCS
jgi:amino acid transporter